MNYSIAVYHQELRRWIDLGIKDVRSVAQAEMLAAVYGVLFRKKFVVVSAGTGLRI